MSRKGVLAVIGLSACLLVSVVLIVYKLHSNAVARRQIRATQVMGTSGQPLKSLFEGLSAKPEYDERRIRASWKRREAAMPRCGTADKPGPFSWLVRLLKPTAVRASEYCVGSSACGGPRAVNADEPCSGGVCQFSLVATEQPSLGPL